MPVAHSERRPGGGVKKIAMRLAPSCQPGLQMKNRPKISYESSGDAADGARFGRDPDSMEADGKGGPARTRGNEVIAYGGKRYYASSVGLMRMILTGE
jgi:hypothetical protein